MASFNCARAWAQLPCHALAAASMQAPGVLLAAVDALTASTGAAAAASGSPGAATLACAAAALLCDTLQAVEQLQLAQKREALGALGCALLALVCGMHIVVIRQCGGKEQYPESSLARAAAGV